MSTLYETHSPGGEVLHTGGTGEPGRERGRYENGHRDVEELLLTPVRNLMNQELIYRTKDSFIGLKALKVFWSPIPFSVTFPSGNAGGGGPEGPGGPLTPQRGVPPQRPVSSVGNPETGDPRVSFGTDWEVG